MQGAHGTSYNIGGFVVFLLEWDAPTLHTQALRPLQVEAFLGRCFSPMRRFAKDIHDSGTMHITLQV